ncbi:MAG: hypothetical protein JST00_42625 [Deltaproteobacteria bacterium]|nr:hypothetical protein [Deltaproteobacteria bacterium]
MMWLASRITRSRRARLLLGILVVSLHLLAFIAQGKLVFNRGFSNGGPPTIGATAPLHTLANWRRLVVSSWDSGQYIHVGLRGYSRCPGREDTKKGDLRELIQRCNVNFYPTYGWMAMYLKNVARIPPDWGLFLLATLAGIASVYVMTSRAIVSAIGQVEAVLAVFLLAIYPSAFYFVAIMTESSLLLTSLGAFVLMRERRYLLGALVAGMGTALHFRGTGIGIAFGGAVLLSFLTDSPRTRKEIVTRVLALPASVWGGLAICGYFWWKFNDPLLYPHSGNANRWIPGNSDGTPFFSLGASLKLPYAGWLIILTVLLCALSLRSVMKEFRPQERLYMVLYVAFLSTSLFTRAGDWLGMSRYLFSIFPFYLFMARTFRGRTAALGIWTVLSLAQYWYVELCLFIGFGAANQCIITKYG